jgi:hypothetical protein
VEVESTTQTGPERYAIDTQTSPNPVAKYAPSTKVQAKQLFQPTNKPKEIKSGPTNSQQVCKIFTTYLNFHSNKQRLLLNKILQIRKN